MMRSSRSLSSATHLSSHIGCSAPQLEYVELCLFWKQGRRDVSPGLRLYSGIASSKE
jgi:hypothetical protein